MSLKAELDLLKAKIISSIPKEAVEAMDRAQKLLEDQKLGENSLAVGDKFPSFNLSDQVNDKTSLEELLEAHKFLIISFYRGGWCPYCNMELEALNGRLDQYHELGAQLVAITPERPDHSLSTAEKNQLEFQVLTDEGSELSKSINICYELPEFLVPIYNEVNIFVDKHNGDYNLPIPATFILDRKGTVIHRFIDVDYTKRLDPLEILNILKSN